MEPQDQKSIQKIGEVAMPRSSSNAEHVQKQHKGSEKDDAFETIGHKNFCELFMNLDVQAIEEQEKDLLGQVDRLVKQLEDMVNTGKAELFLACEIDRARFFDYFKKALQDNASYEYMKAELGDLSEFEKEWSVPIVESLCKLRFRFIEVLREKIAQNPSLKDKVVFGDKRKRLGEGGMGSVHTFGAVSEAPRNGEHVMGYFVPENLPLTIKAFKKGVRTDFNPEVVRRLLGLRHKNVVSFLGYHRLGDNVVALQEYVEGGRSFKEVFSEVLDGTRQLSPADFMDIVLQTVEGTLAMSRAGLAHLDLKMANVVVRCDEQNRVKNVKVIDFDIAHLLELPTDPDKPVIGTPGLWAPERFYKNIVLDKADVYSIGAMLCHILYGDMPNIGAKYFSPDEYFDSRIITKVPQPIREKLGRLIEIDPENRADLAEARQIVLELKEMAQGEYKEYFESLIEKAKNRKKKAKSPIVVAPKSAEHSSSHDVDIPFMPYAPAQVLEGFRRTPQKDHTAELLFQAGLAKEILGDLKDAQAMYQLAVSKEQNTAFMFHLMRVGNKIDKQKPA